jgi:hypothetical protein
MDEIRKFALGFTQTLSAIVQRQDKELLRDDWSYWAFSSSNKLYEDEHAAAR